MFSSTFGPRGHKSNGLLDNDIEKRRTSFASDDDPSPSLVSASSNPPLLSAFAPRSGNNYALRYHVPRRRFSRYFTCAVAGVLILFASYLVLSAWNNESILRLGAQKKKEDEGPPPPPPPAWEQFPFLKKYYAGITTLVQKSENIPEFPTSADDQTLLDAARNQKAVEDVIDPEDGTGFQKRDEATDSLPGLTMPEPLRFDPHAPFEDDASFEKRAPCFLNTSNKAEIPQILAYPGVPKGFPAPAMGSHELFGLRDDVCFERYGRLGPYGLGYPREYGGTGAGMEGHTDGSDKVWQGALEVDYRGVDWADAQERCMQANSHRFRSAVGGLNHFYSNVGAGGPVREEIKNAADADKDQDTAKMIGPNGKRIVPRTAVIIRTWKDYKYDDEDLLYLRALINELSLQSGSQYVVHFLIHVKNDDLQIWADDETYQQALNDALPAEFRGMGTLWSERQMSLVYGGVPSTVFRDLPVYGVYRSTYLPVQYFAHQHPEYDFFWHWEMDLRYTGHFRDLFERVGEFARQQPRKELWERNGRFYIPEKHGSWKDFTEMVHKQSEEGVAVEGIMADRFALDAATRTQEYLEASKPQRPVWGPVRPTGRGDTTANAERDPKPPRNSVEDDYEWGVGEEADFITFNPLFDPHNTNWILAEDVTGYNTSKGFPPRRTAIITTSRLSRRLLDVMHRETAFKRHLMFSEMWPGSMALHHGLKAVYAPHPVYVNRRWPMSYLAEVFNNGMHGAAGGSRASVFSDEKQQNFHGTTWYYETTFAPNLWRRWFGYRTNGEGGEEWETSSSPTIEGQGQGRMCLPAMLLHPIKQLDLVLEREAGV